MILSYTMRILKGDRQMDDGELLDWCVCGKHYTNCHCGDENDRRVEKVNERDL